MSNLKPILHAGPGLLIGIPTLGRPVSLDWAFAFKSMNPPINYNCYFHVIKGAPVADARNAMVKKAQELGAKYLFFLGDDVLCPNHTLRQLIFRMENNPDLGVVGGVYCSKTTPAAPLVFKGNGQGTYWDWKIGEYFEVTGMGMDCTLIRMDVFNDVSEPWFQTIDKDKFLDGKNSAESWTEDLWFLKEMAKHAPQWKIFIDSFVICGHEDVYAPNGGKIYNLPPDSLPMRRKAALKALRALVIGPPLPEGYEKLLLETFDITRIGNDDEADYRGITSSLPFAENQFDRVIVTTKDFYRPEAERVIKFPGVVEIYNGEGA